MCEIENKKENVMLNPAETAQAVSSSMEHKAHMPLTSIIFLAIMAGAAIDVYKRQAYHCILRRKL